MPPEAELPPVLARAQRSFSQSCGVAQPDGSCKSLLAVMHRFAAFQKRVFAPDTPCAERRVLVIRESFSDAVGVGHLHNGFVRFLALALAMGRALVFSACTSDADPWAVRGYVEHKIVRLRRLLLDRASGCPRACRPPWPAPVSSHTGPLFRIGARRAAVEECAAVRLRPLAPERGRVLRGPRRHRLPMVGRAAAALRGVRRARDDPGFDGEEYPCPRARPACRANRKRGAACRADRAP